MGQKEKLLKRLLTMPRDFEFEEMVSLLGHCGYKLYNNGKMSGSSVRFANENGDVIRFHKPHPNNLLKRYILEGVIEKLKQGGII